MICIARCGILKKENNKETQIKKSFEKRHLVSIQSKTFDE
ncbi:hypothetical protein BUZ15_10590 [Staphylococcus gallinarum]|uniref:Uncharacterized protein n=1 Tax=Staphylococcus gallinarum TaxID=1293 RepID=A0A2T4SVA6_STAGA|nr:hypothetical protein BUZ15_10590 [Staphylococcus gallinarum]PTL10089.1 hypothetical protein BUZ09_04295 [Staphylococcus gallinarum]RIL32396.1 hypothetical protein BUY98_09955 [Staphylococcus gallinarum]RIL42077.1 hypothetical protein BUZ01_09880 [Staphylococcus gallinarum]RIO75496.1 hypothetical protein BUZ12_11100 [Staphylococcus gallinarum]